MVGGRIPISTYRLQFTPEFSFQDGEALVPYLDLLGISDVYASPILTSRRGSTHGYDITDPRQVNPELGGEAGFEALCRELQAHGMGLVVDIVPNHMAASPENPWWMDVLANGRASPYADFFDIDWRSTAGAPAGRVLLPILGSSYRDALLRHEVALRLRNGILTVLYHGHVLPLDVKSYLFVLSQRHAALKVELRSDRLTAGRLKGLMKAVSHLPDLKIPDLDALRESYPARENIRRDLQELIAAETSIRSWVERNVALFNDQGNEPRAAELKGRLLARQAYRLAFWRTGAKRINYRRFFDINDLVGTRVEDERVFGEVHSLVRSLIRKGKVTGLRVDHVDGLRDPFEYLNRVQTWLDSSSTRAPGKSGVFLVVEKILGDDESLPTTWPVHGTTGYDFLNCANSLLVDEQGSVALRRGYARSTGSSIEFNDIVYSKKKQVMRMLFTSDIRTLVRQLAELASESPQGTGLSERDLASALTEVTACLPVYRTYIRTSRVATCDRKYVTLAADEARRRSRPRTHRGLAFLRTVILLHLPSDAGDAYRRKCLAFVMCWQQFTGAVMAKGLEDTALYDFNPLLSLNDVGGNPVVAEDPVREFHRFNRQRGARWPHTLNATSTHDTKRGEDVRARINVLSEVPEEWDRRFAKWSEWNSPAKAEIQGHPVPEPAMEWLLYQTLIGAWPLAEEDIPSFKGRLEGYLVKAAREAKTRTNWLAPDKGYEQALLAFTRAILDGAGGSSFLTDFAEFQRRIAFYGAVNSLSQLLVKVTSPGIPDFYQGSELWDLSLVDPDNRRKVDFDLRRQLLGGMPVSEGKPQASLVAALLSTWEDGRIKLYTTCRALGARRSYRELFMDGQYIPLRARGSRRNHVCAFARRLGCTWALTIVPRLVTCLVRTGDFPLGQEVWGGDFVRLPPGSPTTWTNALTGELCQTLAGDALPLSIALREFPVSLLVGDAAGGTRA